MKRLYILPKALLCICICLCIFACTDSGSSGKSSGADKTASNKSDTNLSDIKDTHSNDGRNVVGISMPSKRLERWNRDSNYLKKNFSEKGYEVILSFADDLIDNQYHDIEDMIENGADVLIIASIDGSALGSVLEKAEAANVPVIAYDRLLMNSDAVDYYVSFDNYMVGQLQGEFIEESLNLNDSDNKKTYNLEIASGDTFDNNARYFYNGMFDVLSPYIKSKKIKTLSSQESFFETATSSWSTDLARERFSGLLNSYYLDEKTRLDAVACANDSIALGVATAIESDYNKDNPVIITGQDCDNANIRNVIDQKQSMSVYKALSNQTKVALAVGEALISHKTPDESLIAESGWDFECVYDTTSYNNNAIDVKAYLLTPTVVTKDNYYQTLVEPGYYYIADDGYPVAAE